MATDAEVRSKKLDEYRSELQRLRDLKAQNNEQIRLAKLEDDAQAQLTSAQRDALNQGGITDKTDLSVLQAEKDRLQTLIDALQALVDAVRQVS